MGTLVHHKAASVRAEAAKMFWEIAGAHDICADVHYPVPEFASLVGGDWIYCISPALAALCVGLYDPMQCPSLAHIQLQSPPGTGVTLRTAKLRHRDKCRLQVPYATPPHGHHGPHHSFLKTDDPWLAALRECLDQCADEHLHYCLRKRGPTNHPRWRDALVNQFHTTGRRDCRLRLMHHTGSLITPDGLHLHLGGHCRKGDLSASHAGGGVPPAGCPHVHPPRCDGQWRTPGAQRGRGVPEPLRPRPHAPTPVWLVTSDNQCTQAAEQPQLWAQWVVVQGGAGQLRPRGLPRGSSLLVATAVPHDPLMALHALEDQREDTGHLLVHQPGGPAWLREHLTALRSWASNATWDKIRLHDHPAACPEDELALSVYQLAPGHPQVPWHSAALNAGWLSPCGYHWIPEACSHASSDASGGRPCTHASSVALAADLAHTWAVAIPDTVPDGAGVAGSLPLQYGTDRPWFHTVNAQIIFHLLRHADQDRTTRVPAGAGKAVDRMTLKWLQDGLRVRGQRTEHPFWFARATFHHSDPLLHNADWAASQDTVLQNTLPGPCHAELIVTGSDGHLEPCPPTMRTLGTVAQQTQLGHTSTQRGHTPLGTAHATAYVRTRDLTAVATNHGALRARDGHTPVQRRLRTQRAAVLRICSPTAMPPLRGQGGNPGTHACGLHPLTAPLATLPAGRTRSSVSGSDCRLSGWMQAVRSGCDE